MFDVLIRDDKGNAVDRIRCMATQCSVGKGRNNLVVLKGWKVEPVHAEFTQSDDGIFVENRAVNGAITVNDERTQRYGPLRSRDVVSIGRYRLSVGLIEHAEAGSTSTESPPADAAVPDTGPSPAPDSFPEPATEAGAGEAEMTASVSAVAAPAAESREPAPVAESAPPATKSKHDDDDDVPEFLMRTMVGVRPHAEVEPDEKIEREERFRWRNRIHQQILHKMDLRRIDIGSMEEGELSEHVKSLIDEVISGMSAELPASVDRQELAREVLNEAIGLGPLEDLIADESVTEIMVNRYDDIYIEADGRLKKSDVTFSSDNAVFSAIERIVSPLGRRIDESSPMVDARLKDGSRVNAIIPPLALRGPTITIRKFAVKKLTSDDLISFGAINENMCKFLEMAVRERCNIVISGGTGSGKTTLLNVLSNFIPHSERVITVEDAAELKLNMPHLVSLEARPPNIEGKGAIPIRDLVKNCLRMRPDRIVVGECRGGEALDMLQAMNTGHDGSLTTAHANSPRDVVARLEVMVMMSGMDLPISAIRDQVASAVDLVVQQTRFADGSRRVTHISEVTGVEGDTIQMQDIFRYRQKGFDADGRVMGHFESTGQVPQFYEGLRERGVAVDMSVFG